MSIARSRLVQFVVLGGLVFAVAPRPPNLRDIDVRSDRLRAIAAIEAGRRAGPPEAPEEIEEQQIEDEILYREALRLGLDKSDGVVRGRLVQKALFLAEEIAGTSRPPKEADLRAFFERNRERWTSHTPSRPARFEEVRQKVIQAYGLWRRQEAVARFLESAFARYRVTVDGAALTKITPTRRVAYRAAASGED